MGPDANEQAKAVIQRSIIQGASDIHVGHFRDQTCIRYQIGGALQETESVPKSAGIALCDAMKHGVGRKARDHHGRRGDDQEERHLHHLAAGRGVVPAL